MAGTLEAMPKGDELVSSCGLGTAAPFKNDQPMDKPLAKKKNPMDKPSSAMHFHEGPCPAQQVVEYVAVVVQK